MNKALTNLLELFCFAVDHKDKAFKDWPAAQIFVSLTAAVKRGECLALRSKEDGEIHSLVFGELRDDTMHVISIICNKKGRVKTFFNQFRKKWPGVKKLSGKRHGKQRIYTLEMMERIVNYG